MPGAKNAFAKPKPRKIVDDPEPAPMRTLVVREPTQPPYAVAGPRRFGCMAGTMTIHGDLTNTGESWEAEG